MIKREAYMERIRPFIGTDIIKVLTGIRRCGKSVMLELIQEELVQQGISRLQIVKLNFEEIGNAPLCTATALYENITAKMAGITGKAYIFLDEIQEVEEWERCINSLRVEFDCDIYITGSNAKLLSGELATYLAGRYVEFPIYPFSFQEFTILFSTIKPGLPFGELFQKYIVHGGMPYLSNIRFEDAPSKMYLQDLYSSIVLKDIVRRNKVRDVDLLERIIAYVFSNIGTTFSASSISKFFLNENRVVAPETIMNYISFCVDAFLFHRVRRNDLHGKKVLTINEKYFITDHGMREAVYGNNMRDINMVLENIVYMEAIRRGYEVTVGKHGDKEIDFVCQSGSNRLYIQVTYLLASEETIKREFGAYKSIDDHYPKYVVSMDEIDMSRDGIKHVNVREFLLLPSWE